MDRKRKRRAPRRGRGKGNKFDARYVWVFLSMIVFFLAIARYPDAMHINSSVGMTLTTLFPGLLLTSMAIYMFSRSDRQGAFGGMMFIGMAMAVFIGMAGTNGLITVEMIAGLTIQQVQIWVMAFSVIIGAAVFSLK